MWLTSADQGVQSANLWLLLITIVSTGGTLAATWITVRRGKQPASHDAAQAAVREYRKTFAEPLRRDYERERERRLAAEAESDGHRARWVECEQRHGGAPHD